VLDIGRRDFIALLGGAAAWPPAARAQQPATAVIGLLGGGAPESFASALAGFNQGLQEIGIVEGRNAEIEARWARVSIGVGLGPPIGIQKGPLA
jgi:putative tryptophan/tyrosine transport system substrate-binding protein